MKRMKFYLFGLLMILIGISCNSAKDPHRSPKTITKAFVESLYVGHYDEAKTYVTPESVPIINFFRQAFPPEYFKNCDHGVTTDEITVKELSDSTAICKCIVHLCNGKVGNESICGLSRINQR